MSLRVYSDRPLVDTCASPAVRPWIVRDAKNFKECSIDEAFLVDISDQPPESLDTTCLLRECIESILPICNGEFRVEGLKVDPSDIKSHLAAYSAKHDKHEKELYRDFVKAVNTALQCLERLSIAKIHRFNGPQMFFHVNGLSPLTQSHQDKGKPDIVLVSEPDARVGAHGSEGDIYQLKDFMPKVAISPPNQQSKWRSVRAFIECRTSKRRLVVPPRLYTYKPEIQPTERDYLTAGALIHEPGTIESDTSHLPLNQQEMAANTSSDSRKRKSKRLETASSKPKRQKTEPRMDHTVIVQEGSYAAEMFAAHAGRQLGIGLIMTSSTFGIMTDSIQFDAQASTLSKTFLAFLCSFSQCNALKITTGGLSPDINPDLDLSSSEERVTHVDLDGRATNLFPATGPKISRDEGLVAKLFWTEVSRERELDMPKHAYEIAEGNGDVQGHVPEMACYHTRSCTAVMNRQRLGLETDGARVSRLTVWGGLKPITNLVGDDFLRAWWASVKCHRALWAKGVHHRDVSASNLAYYRNAQGSVVGVLNDFDLASIVCGPSGFQRRIGTVPFMALDLLRNGEFNCNIEHSYEHDAESFIWVLTWIALRYDDGTLRTTKRPFNKWLTVDALACRGQKLGFLFPQSWRKLQPGKGHEENLKVVDACLVALMTHMGSVPMSYQVLADEDAFETFLRDPVARFLS